MVPEQESAVTCSVYGGECVQYVLEAPGVRKRPGIGGFIAGWLQEQLCSLTCETRLRQKRPDKLDMTESTIPYFNAIMNYNM